MISHLHVSAIGVYSAHVPSISTFNEQTRPPKQAGAGCVHLLIASFADQTAGNEHDIPPRLDLRHAKTNDFAQLAFDAVAFDSAANARTDRKSKTTVRQFVGKSAQNDRIATVRASLGANLLEALVSAHSIALFHMQRSIIRQTCVWSTAPSGEHAPLGDGAAKRCVRRVFSFGYENRAS
jgi:hypothetical protein